MPWEADSSQLVCCQRRTPELQVPKNQDCSLLCLSPSPYAPPAISAQAQRRKSAVLSLTSLIQHWLPRVNVMGHVLFGHYSVNSVLEKNVSNILKQNRNSRNSYVLPALGMCYSDFILYYVLFLITGIFIQTQKTASYTLKYVSSELIS